MQAMVKTTAAQIICFFIGGGLKQKGLPNAMSNHVDFNDDDLKQQSIKEVYATVLNRRLAASNNLISGKKYKK